MDSGTPTALGVPREAGESQTPASKATLSLSFPPGASFPDLVVTWACTHEKLTVSSPPQGGGHSYGTILQIGKLRP